MEIWPIKAGDILIAEANIAKGWRLFKNGRPGFCEQAFLDVSGDCKVRIQAILDARTMKAPRGIPMRDFDALVDTNSLEAQTEAPHRISRILDVEAPQSKNVTCSGDLKFGAKKNEFPTDFEASGCGKTLAFRIGDGILRLAINRPHASSEWLSKAKKPGVYEHLPTIGCFGGNRYTLQVWVTFTTAFKKVPLTIKEWDLLPFLSGGQFESSRRRH